MVALINSKISSTATSGNLAKLGIKDLASSTDVSVATKFISAATSKLCSSNSSPESVSLRNAVSALYMETNG